MILSMRQKLLTVLRNYPDGIKLEDLVVAVWKAHPGDFSLSGHPHPSDNKVIYMLSGDRGLVGRGFVTRVRQKFYALSSAGLAAVRGMVPDADDGPVPDFPVLPDRLDKFLRGIFTSSAMDKIDSGKRNLLTFQDACRFWNISGNMAPDHVEERFKTVTKNFNDADIWLEKNGTSRVGRREVNMGTLRALRNVHVYMEDRFEKLLNLLRKRVSPNPDSDRTEASHAAAGQTRAKLSGPDPGPRKATG